MSDLSALIAKLERVTEPFDASDTIREALRFALDRGWIDVTVYRRAQQMCNAGAFTDAALTLVPPGCEAYVTRLRSGKGKAYVGADPCPSAFCVPVHPAPALALIIASLKARALSTGGEASNG